MWSVECEVWGGMCGDRSVEYEVWSVECVVWSVECRCGIVWDKEG